jgi:hypothetical protein
MPDTRDALELIKLITAMIEADRFNLSDLASIG